MQPGIQRSRSDGRRAVAAPARASIAPTCPLCSRPAMDAEDTNTVIPEPGAPRLDGTNICQLIKKYIIFFFHTLLPYPGINFYEACLFWAGQAPKLKNSGSGVPWHLLGFQTRYVLPRPLWNIMNRRRSRTQVSFPCFR